MLALLMIAAQAGAAEPAREPFRLNLVCSGQGSQEKGGATQVYSRDSDGNARWTTVTGPTSVTNFADEVRIQIEDQVGQIRVPQTMLPTIRGGKNGWFRLRDIAVSRDEITAIATINLLNKVRLRVDRITGLATFTVKDGSFAGRCVPLPINPVERAF